MKTKAILFLILFATSGLLSSAPKQVRIGIIGLDTSHSIAFAEFLNGDDKSGLAKDFRIVAAYPYGSKTIPSSYERIPSYIEKVEKLGVKIVSSIEELLEEVDFVLLETNDGTIHLEQANEVFKSGKPMFIDKPLGGSLAQAIAIYELSKKYDVPFFSSSALRFVPQNQQLRAGEFGRVVGADCFSPGHIEPSHADLAWYGIHGVETLFTVMGAGCVEVSRITSDSTDVAVGKWDDGRIGSFRGIRLGVPDYGGMVFTTNNIVRAGSYSGYGVLLDEILKFFSTGVVPVSEKETLEIFTFIEAADESKRQGGKPVSMADTYRKRLKDATKLIRGLE